MSESKDARTARLKAALRQNLRRRKAQERGRAEVSPAADAEPLREERETRGPDSDKSGL
ncbi:hypothetical protein [Methylobacterium sp. P5_C11]|jgi:hypothetical protein